MIVNDYAKLQTVEKDLFKCMNYIIKDRSNKLNVVYAKRENIKTSGVCSK